MTHFHLVLPSLKVSGGTQEALRLARELDGCQGCTADVLAMWQSPHAVSGQPLQVIALSGWRTHIVLAAFQLPIIAVRFYRRAQRQSVDLQASNRRWIFTHYATLPLSLLVPRAQRWYFVQGLEWQFLGQRTLASQLLKRFLLFAYRRGTVISANTYLTQQLRLNGVAVAAEAPIWADERYAVEPAKARDIDVVMMLRKGMPKRLDLYRLFIAAIMRQSPHIRLAIITPEDEIATAVRKDVATCVVRPDLPEMAALYSRSRLFVFLSEHEGFGLPPLEAMGAGCVPISRDCGGVRSYMTGPLEALIVPLDSDVDAIVARVLSLLADEPQRADLGERAMCVFRAGMTRTRDRVHDLDPLYQQPSSSWP